MPRPLRRDRPGLLHHVLNRGLQRRPLFELPSDQRRFLALLGCAVRRGWIRVHGYCLMTTHFHLVLQSVDGRLSRTMQWLQGCHGGHFNRTRGRDGPLVKSRFTSIPLTSWMYFRYLIRYSDLNPVTAGICRDPLDYPFSSARWHARETTRPRWLARNLVDRFLEPSIEAGRPRREAYRRVFHRSQPPDDGPGLVEARLRHRGHAVDDLDAFLCTDGAGRRAWIMRRALEADGVAAALPMAGQASVRTVLAERRVRSPRARLAGTRTAPRDLWNTAEAGLLRDLAGLGFTAMARELGVAVSTARTRYGHHQIALREDAAYLPLLEDVAREALIHCYGPEVQELAERLADAHLCPDGVVLA